MSYLKKNIISYNIHLYKIYIKFFILYVINIIRKVATYLFKNKINVYTINIIYVFPTFELIKINVYSII